MRPGRRRERGGRDLLRPRAFQRPHAGKKLHDRRPAGADGVPPSPGRARVCDVQHAHFPVGARRCRGLPARHHRRRRGRRHRPGHRHLPAHPLALAGFSHPLLHADDDHQCRGRGVCPRARRAARGARARELPRRHREDQRRPVRRRGAATARGLRSRRALRGLLGPVPDERIARRALCESRRVRPGLPPPVRSHFRWQTGTARRPPLPA